MFFYLSKLFWTFAAPGNLILAIGFSGLALQFRTRTAGLGRRLTAAALLALAVVAVLPIGDLARAPLEGRFPPVPALPGAIDGVIVLGGAVDTLLSGRRGTPVVNDASERLFALAAMARRYPGARMVYSGGSGSVFGQDFKETQGVSALLADLGLDPGRVLYESQSRNTYENVVFSKNLVQPRAGETWLLVTSAFHMPRSVGIFRAAGWAVLPYPVDYRTGGLGHLVWPLNLHDGLSGLEIAMREWIGLAVYWATGRSQSLFPAP